MEMLAFCYRDGVVLRMGVLIAREVFSPQVIGGEGRGCVFLKKGELKCSQRNRGGNSSISSRRRLSRRTK